MNRENVTSANYEQLYKASDIERQFIIESYGYKFLRINRFNLGHNPITTLSDRLYQLIKNSSIKNPLKSLDQIMEHNESLASGKSKVCAKCEKILPIQNFFDKKLANGKGAYGRNCMACKNNHRHKRRWSKRYY